MGDYWIIMCYSAARIVVIIFKTHWQTVSCNLWLMAFNSLRHLRPHSLISLQKFNKSQSRATFHPRSSQKKQPPSLRSIRTKTPVMVKMQPTSFVTTWHTFKLPLQITSLSLSTCQAPKISASQLGKQLSSSKIKTFDQAHLVQTLALQLLHCKRRKQSLYPLASSGRHLYACAVEKRSPKSPRSHL